MNYIYINNASPFWINKIYNFLLYQTHPFHTSIMKNTSLNLSSNQLPSIQTLISNPIPQCQYQNLQQIIKILTQFMNSCVKNRQYIQAQKAKDKIQQAQSCIKTRNANYISDRRMANMRRLQAKHEQERQLFMHQWNIKLSTVQDKFNQQMQKKKRINQQQIARLRQQIQLALPHSFSPDQKLKSLRHEQKHLANQGHFIQAQKIKDQIQSRQLALEQKHRKLRETNIKAMLEQLQEKHQKDLRDKHKQKKVMIDQIVRERNKKLKQMEDRQSKEIRQMKWMHDEQIRMMH